MISSGDAARRSSNATTRARDFKCCSAREFPSAMQALRTRPRHFARFCAAAEYSAEFFLRKRGQPLQLRSKQRPPFQRVPLPLSLRASTRAAEMRRARHGRLAIPRTNVLANSHPTTAVPICRAALPGLRRAARSSNRKCTCAIEHVRRGNAWWARIQAPRTIPAHIAAAVRPLQRSSQIQCRDDHAKKSHEPIPWLIKHVFFASHPSPAYFAAHAFDDRSRIHVCSRFERPQQIARASQRAGHSAFRASARGNRRPRITRNPSSRQILSGTLPARLRLGGL